MERPSLGAIALTYFRIGTTTFGSGGATMVRLGHALMDRQWMQRVEFHTNFTLARITPGTNVMAFVVGTGYSIRGWPGALAALLSLSVPAACIVVLLTVVFEHWRESAIGQSALALASAAVVGLIVAAAWLLAAPKARKTQYLRTATLVCGAAFLSKWLTPVEILLLGAVVGYVWPGRAE